MLHTFLSIGAVGRGGGIGRHSPEQTKAHEFSSVPVYPLQAQHLVLGHALDIVQVEVKDVFLLVVVVFLVVVIVVISLVFIVVIVIFLVFAIFLIDGQRHTGHFSLDGGSGRCL